MVKHVQVKELITPPFYFIKKINFSQAEALKNESTKNVGFCKSYALL